MEEAKRQCAMRAERTAHDHQRNQADLARDLEACKLASAKDVEFHQLANDSTINEVLQQPFRRLHNLLAASRRVS